MTEPAAQLDWIGVDVAQAIHDAQLSRHGGPTGVRSPSLLESALARPRNAAAYASADVVAAAAAYAYGLASNHPFADGNKRTAWTVCETFLNLNGVDVAASDAEVVTLVVALAAGEVSEPELERWLRARCVRRAAA
ncbi:MAG: type II toxin-antitoxin system death-on-curing family toxin [Pseudomonadota bacterium]